MVYPRYYQILILIYLYPILYEKKAARSSGIEGTKATIVDVVKAKLISNINCQDVDRNYPLY
jgi:hypothetical protein